MFFLTIIPGLLIADVLWWIWSDRRIRAGVRSDRARVALRWLVAIFMTGQIALYLFVIGGRFVGVRSALPGWLLAQVYVWHLFVLPFTIVVWLLYLMVNGLITLCRERSERS